MFYNIDFLQSERKGKPNVENCQTNSLLFSEHHSQVFDFQ